jgi:hypothetical protein
LGRHKFKGFDARLAARIYLRKRTKKKEPRNDVASMHLSDKAITGGATPARQQTTTATTRNNNLRIEREKEKTDEYSSRPIESRKYPSTFFHLLLPHPFFLSLFFYV